MKCWEKHRKTEIGLRMGPYELYAEGGEGRKDQDNQEEGKYRARLEDRVADWSRQSGGAYRSLLVSSLTTPTRAIQLVLLMG